jgi:hypothetical protein
MSEIVKPLREEEDAFGRLLLDYLEGQAGDAFLDRDDGQTGPAMGPEWFFASWSSGRTPNEPCSGTCRATCWTSVPEPAGIASRRSVEGSRRWRSMHRRGLWRCVAAAGSKMSG